MRSAAFSAAAILLIASGAMTMPGAGAQQTLAGTAAYGDFSRDAPGTRRHITEADLPAPSAAETKANMAGIIPQPAGATPLVPPGFTVKAFARLNQPRLIRVAPNGDIFVAETTDGQVRVLHAADGADGPSETAVFAKGLSGVFGIAFYPAGPNPSFVYVATERSIIRYPYQNGDLTARGPAETIVPTVPHGGSHWTRDLAFSTDGARLFVSVGSATNGAETLDSASPAEIQAAEAERGLGAGWGPEAWRAGVLVTSPDGKTALKSFANGIRNCASLAIEPKTGAPWCTNNERDTLGDNLPPDYVTPIREGAFYGWPWYYIGNHEDPNHSGERPDLAGKITTPEVLIQPHSAPLGLTFYTGAQFPADYRGDAFVALHGSWARAKRTGYKVIRVIVKDGKPTGEYEDFLTGFVAGERGVWGRPVGVAVAHDGALLVSEDANGVIWRIAYTGRTQ